MIEKLSDHRRARDLPIESCVLEATRYQPGDMPDVCLTGFGPDVAEIDLKQVDALVGGALLTLGSLASEAGNRSNPVIVMVVHSDACCSVYADRARFNTAARRMWARDMIPLLAKSLDEVIEPAFREPGEGAERPGE